jgi:hypothetical protein
MALPSSGTISMSQINTELARSSTANISLDTAENGGYGAINQNSSSRPSANNPAAMSEWYSYNHTAADPDFLLHLRSNDYTSYPGSGTTWYDISGNSNNGTLTNKYASNPIYTGSGFEFQGSNAYSSYQYGRYVSFPNYQFGRVNSQNRVTLDVYFYPTESSYPMILAGNSFNGETPTYQGYQLWTYGTTLYGRISGGGTTYVDTSYSFSLNTFIHAVLTYDGSTARLYVNGSLVSSSSISVTMNYAAPGLFLIGAQYNAGYGTNTAEFYTGYIMVVRLYSRALSGSEVSTLYSQDTAS